ncbi:hypothetical protein O6H91_03G086100 [Diphasiastrum complanatum]|uniref:Uncharacterized protein n=1 Tax=Diphasiastrum complanatum TaxID=34168 RepID=A0ACC2E8V2_DIPCM|nr:hypothetical protein O6H91_03G086100 [Diphasiastrum complanatum]
MQLINRMVQFLFLHPISIWKVKLFYPQSLKQLSILSQERSKWRRFQKLLKILDWHHEMLFWQALMEIHGAHGYLIDQFL